ncbi:MAG: nucleoside triphosphate pyrophosphohydrolase [Anaerolineae bacterium]|jgi:tetrapyrrole methylase family protein / MazG family protein|nr:nucleoside triphosphate pyrophosphohydrolase [Anaerolineae bacterium]MBT7074467.1 nucleoside triphosphate pyrophosphohydrolase [Anaerolineae bacterium]MBT7781294.1 nucleoside triphosphate pyrophosphohydrolase [Anaerolineae bacterium]
MLNLLSTLNLENAEKLILLNADELKDAHVPPFQPDFPVLIWGNAPLDLEGICRVLQTTYSVSHSLRIATESGVLTDLNLGLLAANGKNTEVSAIFLSALDAGTSLSSFQEIVAHLRAPNGCPWDQKQTHKSLRPHLLEESYETLDAIGVSDYEGMAEEFGDLLLQIVLHAQIGTEESNFSMSEIIKGIYDKILRRHPHVFGEENLDSVDEVLSNWEALKEKERKDSGKSEKGILDGVPLSFPALNQSQEYQERAARVGFDWGDISGVLDKLVEEIVEIQEAETEEEIASEIGDLFFVLVNFARWQNVDAESALREANIRFKGRFSYIEQCARGRKISIQDMTLDEMEFCWDEAKKNGL